MSSEAHAETTWIELPHPSHTPKTNSVERESDAEQTMHTKTVTGPLWAAIELKSDLLQSFAESLQQGV